MKWKIYTPAVRDRRLLIMQDTQGRLRGWWLDGNQVINDAYVKDGSWGWLVEQASRDITKEVMDFRKFISLGERGNKPKNKRKVV